jgi:nicotinamidase-related amidase
MSGATRDNQDGHWLVVIDMQNVFGEDDGAWFTPRFAEAADRIKQLVPAFAGRTVFTRFVAPSEPPGAWADYYDEFSFALQPSSHPLYRITDELAPLVDKTVQAHTFGKWTADLRALVGETPELVVCGVATDCCVLSTVLPAIDAGARALVVTDACAGSTDENHQKALDVMGLYQPLTRFATTDEVLSEA